MKTRNEEVDMAAVERIVTMREGLSLLKQFPEDILHVRYESLCSNPQDTMAKIIDFLELANDDELFFRYAKSSLKLPAANSTYTLNPLIHDSFLATMCELGYA